MKHRQWIAIFLLCALLLSGLCGCKGEDSSSAGKKPGKEDVGDEPGGNGGTPQNPDKNSGSDFWENEEGLTVPPLTAPPETAEEVASEVMTALQNADWETFNRRSLSYVMTGTGSGNLPEGGIMEKIMRSITVTEKTVTDNGDGTYCASITLSTIDFRALVESLPDSVSHEDAAVEEMLRLADTAKRTSFSGTFTILRYSTVGRYYIQPDITFINAITGGFYDYYEDVMGGAVQ